MKYKRVVIFYLIFFAGVSTAFGIGYLVGRLQSQAQSQHFSIVSDALTILQNHAYEPLPDALELEYGMIRGMVATLDDPYTRFEAPVQHELASNQLQGSYGGIGVSLDRDPDGFIILHPFSDGPAALAGVLDGDRLMAVDQLPITTTLTIDDIIAALRWPEGEKVRIQVQRPLSAETLNFSITRKEFPIPSVTWHLEPYDNRLGIIKVNLIAASTITEIENAVDDLAGRGATHYALDLRGNRGGLLTEGIETARLFLAEGAIVAQQYKGQEVETYEVKKRGALAEIPLVVLIDSNTASAAEIIAGALQAQERAPLIGTNSYGKDSIQLIFDLEGGASLHVTAAKWWVPGLVSPVGAGGLRPDIEIATAESDLDPYIAATIQYFWFFGNRRDGR